jgi:hypothetical protein
MSTQAGATAAALSKHKLINPGLSADVLCGLSAQ